MANDRVYLVCKCGEMQLFGKWFPSSGLTMKDDTPDRMMAFSNEHLVSCGEFGHKIDRLPFRLATESEMP